MQRKNIKSILEKIRSGNLTPKEETIAKYWIHKLNPGKPAEYSDEDLERVSDEMWQVLTKEQVLPARTTRLWPPIAAAASIIIAIGVGFFFYTNQSKKDIVRTATYANDVAPGKIGATLTLGSGRKIKLSAAANGEIAKEAGISVAKTADGQLVYQINPSSKNETKRTYNTLTTANGETYILTLPDKSKVWMNAASSLTYATALNERGQRRVKLSGEAYFEIAKDKAHPFVVESKGQEVEVLGTHFNVNAYDNEPVIRTTLIEGSVRISDHQSQKILKPGFEAVNTGSGIQLNNVDTELAVAWKNNKFVFDETDIRYIMRMIGRWYNVEVIYTGTIPEEKFWGSVSRYENVSEVLKSLEQTGKIKFRIAGRRIYVSP